MIKPENHPSQEELSAFTLGQLSTDEATEIENHIAACDPCCETLLGPATQAAST